jgi:PAS domain S-box-containing protein
MLDDGARGLDLAVLETLFQSAPFGVALVDRSWRYVRVNEILARLNGLAVEAHEGRAVADVVPHLWPALKPLCERALAGEPIANAEVRGRSGDSPDQVGHRRVTCQPITDGREVVGVGILSTDMERQPDAGDITDRRRADVLDSRITAIVESSDDAIIAKDLAGIITSWNKGAEQTFGYTADEIVGSSITRLIPDDRLGEEERILEAIRRGERVERFETVRHTKDGRRIDVWVVVSPIRDAAGRIIGASKIARDITERRRTREALAQSERRLRALADELTIERAHLLAAQSVARMGSWTTDLRTMAVTWSPETHRIFETDPATFIPTHERFLARVHPADRAAVDQAFAASLQHRGTSTIEHRITMADGRVKCVEEMWRITHGEDGTPLRGVGTIHDITERKEAEERIRAADARLRAVLNNAPVVIFAVNDQGTFSLSEGRGLEGVGLSPGQIVGRSAASMYADIEIVQPNGITLSGAEAVSRVLAGESVTGLTKLGAEYFDNHFVPDRDADGRVVGMIGVSTVVTARRQAELRVQHLNRVYAMLSGINETIVREHDPQKMLESACRLAVERGGFCMAWIGLADEGGTLAITAHAGADVETLQAIRRLIGSRGADPACAFTARAMRNGERGICNDIASDPLSAPWRALAAALGYRSMASLPLQIRGAVVGTFNLYAGAAGAFDTEELRLLDEVAMDIAFGLEVREHETERLRIDQALRTSEARLRESIADLRAVSARLNEAREQERVKMARDIHDHLGQAMTALKMDVAEVRRRLDAGDTTSIRERLGEMSALIDASVNDVRRVAAELRPVVLDDLGFVAAIRAYFIDVERRAQIRCVLNTPLTDLAIAEDRATALFRILQEALTNVARHAEAKRVDVSLTLEAGRVRLAIHDDGRGIPAEATRNPRALGLVGMRDRALLFGGDVVVTGGPGEGTTVTVDLPLSGPPT